MNDSLFPDEKVDFGKAGSLPAALQGREALSVIAAFEIAHVLSRHFRPNRDAAGLGAVADSTRVLFGVEFNNNQRVALAEIAGLHNFEAAFGNGPQLDGLLLRRMHHLRHFLSRILEVIPVVDAMIANGGRFDE